MSDLRTDGPFYHEKSCGAGLRFTCTRCSICCRFDSGFVWLSAEDLRRMSEGLKLPVEDVVQRYCRVVEITGIRRISLAEQENMDCVFWRDGACAIYGHRPLQCRSFPFWAPYLGSREEWDELAETCPGVNIGKWHSAEEIDEWLAIRHREPPLGADNVTEVGGHES